MVSGVPSCMDGRYAKTRLRLTAGMKKRLGLGGARQPRTISGQTIRIEGKIDVDDLTALLFNFNVTGDV